IGLERVVGRPVGPIIVVAPLHMGGAARTVVDRRLVGDGAAYDRPEGKGRGRKPEIAMAPVAGPRMTIAAMPAPVGMAAAPLEAVIIMPAVSPILHLHHIRRRMQA